GLRWTETEVAHFSWLSLRIFDRSHVLVFIVGSEKDRGCAVAAGSLVIRLHDDRVSAKFGGFTAGLVCQVTFRLEPPTAAGGADFADDFVRLLHVLRRIEDENLVSLCRRVDGS